MEETVDRELDEAVDVGLEPAMNSHERMQMSVKPDYTIVKSARKKSKKIPGYKTHDSAADVMAYLGCSRATAFRKIKAGFRIPEREHAIQSRT